ADDSVPVELVGLARLEARPSDHRRLPDPGKSGRRDQLTLRRQRTDHFLRLQLGRWGQQRRARHDREMELETRAVRHRRLLRVPVRRAEVGVLYLDDGQPRVAGCRYGEPRGPAGRHGRDESGEFVVVEQNPTPFELAPANAVHFDEDRGADRPAVRAGEPRRHLQVESGLGIETVALLDNDVMQETEVFRRLKLRRDTAGRVAADRRDAIGDRRIFAAVIFGDGDLPPSLYGAPGEVEFLAGRKTIAGHGHGRAGRATLGRELQVTYVATRGFRPGHFGTN